jgi:predicted Zn-dependent protease
MVHEQRLAGALALKVSKVDGNANAVVPLQRPRQTVPEVIQSERPSCVRERWVQNEAKRHKQIGFSGFILADNNKVLTDRKIDPSEVPEVLDLNPGDPHRWT